MDLRKMSAFIIVLGILVMTPGVLTVVRNQPMEFVEPPKSGDVWKDLLAWAGDPTKSREGVALINLERAARRNQALSLAGIGAIVVFLGVAVRASSKPAKTSGAREGTHD